MKNKECFLCVQSLTLLWATSETTYLEGGADFAPLCSSKMIHPKSRDVYEVIKNKRADRPKNGGRGPQFKIHEAAQKSP